MRRGDVGFITTMGAWISLSAFDLFFDFKLIANYQLLALAISLLAMIWMYRW